MAEKGGGSVWAGCPPPEQTAGILTLHLWMWPYLGTESLYTYTHQGEGIT